MTKKFMTLLATCSLIAGCSSIKNHGEEEIPLSDSQQKAALAEAAPPQQFGISVYPIGNNLALQGNVRLHPRHMATADIETPDVPVIKVTGSAPRMKMNALIDTASAESWIEFDTAQEFDTTFLGMNGKTFPYRGTTYIGNAKAYAAVIPQLRIKQLFMESAPIYVRMAANSLGPLTRGVQTPKIEGVLGYDILRNFEYIQFDPTKEDITFSATTPYAPDSHLFIGAAKIMNKAGAGLIVEGAIDGAPTPILLDFAGNYAFSRSDTNVRSTKQVSLGEIVYMNTPTVMVSAPGSLPRAGLQMLGKYTVTVCPRLGVVYFERPAP